MRETVRKKESDRNSHMEMERRRCMQGRLGKQVMGTENVREDLSWLSSYRVIHGVLSPSHFNRRAET